MHEVGERVQVCHISIMDAEKSLVAWINSNGLSRKIRSLADIADIRLLYELLTQM